MAERAARQRACTQHPASQPVSHEPATWFHRVFGWSGISGPGDGATGQQPRQAGSQAGGGDGGTRCGTVRSLRACSMQLLHPASKQLSHLECNVAIEMTASSASAAPRCDEGKPSNIVHAQMLMNHVSCMVVWWVCANARGGERQCHLPYLALPHHETRAGMPPMPGWPPLPWPASIRPSCPVWVCIC